jgi:putative transposase
MMYIRYPLSLRQVEDLLFERGIDICHETVRFWRNRFGPIFAAEIRKRRVHHRSYSQWRWHLDEVFVRINGEIHYRRRQGREHSARRQHQIHGTGGCGG